MSSPDKPTNESATNSNASCAVSPEGRKRVLRELRHLLMMGAVKGPGFRAIPIPRESREK